MNKSVFKQTAAHLMIGGLSILVGLAAFEGILAIALLNQEESNTESTQIIEQPSKESPQFVETHETPKQKMVKQASVCSSDYYAIFDIDSSALCVKNPTMVMAHWGPPSSSWFHSDGGEFRSQRNDATPSGHCACLASQNEYQPVDGVLGPKPIGRILFENMQIAITKWVCGDSCVTATKGEMHDF